MKKIITLLLLSLTALLVNAQEINLKPGSLLSIYQLERNKTFWDEDQEPINTIVDKTKSFSLYDALSFNKETKSDYVERQYLACVWSGFFEIKEAGVYVFSLQMSATQRGSKCTAYLNDQEYMSIDDTDSSNITTSSNKTLKLEAGIYKLDLTKVHPNSLGSSSIFVYGYQNNSKSIPAAPKLMYWNKLSPTNKTEITPASLIHR